MTCHQCKHRQRTLLGTYCCGLSNEVEPISGLNYSLPCSYVLGTLRCKPEPRVRLRTRIANFFKGLFA